MNSLKMTLLWLIMINRGLNTKILEAVTAALAIDKDEWWKLYILKERIIMRYELESFRICLSESPSIESSTGTVPHSWT